MQHIVGLHMMELANLKGFRQVANNNWFIPVLSTHDLLGYSLRSTNLIQFIQEKNHYFGNPSVMDGRLLFAQEQSAAAAQIPLRRCGRLGQRLIDQPSHWVIFSNFQRDRKVKPYCNSDTFIIICKKHLAVP